MKMPVLKQGSKGPDVVALQTKLKTLGFDPKGTDGNFGPATKTALIAFQKSKNLQADGVAGPLTLAALQLSPTATLAGPPNPTTASPVATNLIPSAPGLNLAGLPGHLPTSVISQIPETASTFGITTNLRLAHFLAQWLFESNRFTAIVENLSYSADRLLKVFPKYFKGVDPTPVRSQSF